MKKYKHKVLLLICSLIIVSATWAVLRFDNLTFSQIYFHLIATKAGTGPGIVFKYLYECIPLSLIISVILIYLFNTDLDKRKRRIRKIALILFVVVSFIYSLNCIGLFKFLYDNLNNSEFIKDNYVDPLDTKIEFLEKRNLIYIYLESMEYTYSDLGLTPELKKLKEDNASFGSIGAHVIGNSSWTTAAMIAESSGLPLNSYLNYNSININNDFLKGVTSLGDILENNGYTNNIMVGSNLDFGSRSNYFREHGNYNIYDLNYMIDNKVMNESDKVFWGFDDSDLFKYAKDKLEDLSNEDRPFNLTMLTVNTHNPEGYLEEKCDASYDSKYENVIACSSKQINDFIEWIKKQDFYSNTTIVLAGDHLSMNTSLMKDMDKDYSRTTYFTIINSYLDNNKTDRLYSTYDIFPTSLASLGASIEGNALGLGVNLYSDNKTLLEEYGIEYVNDELLKYSKYYNNYFYKEN